MDRTLNLTLNCTSRQTSDQASKQTLYQASKQISKQTSKQTSEQTLDYASDQGLDQDLGWTRDPDLGRGSDQSTIPMDSTIASPNRLLCRLCLGAMLLCPAVAIAAGLSHPLRVWAAGGEWCQVISFDGRSQVMYGSRCESSPLGLVRRFN